MRGGRSVLVKDVAPKVTVEPIRGLRVLKDLIVDMDTFFDGYKKVLPYLINDEGEPDKERTLSEADFEFRGGFPRWSGGVVARTRIDEPAF